MGDPSSIRGNAKGVETCRPARITQRLNQHLHQALEQAPPACKRTHDCQEAQVGTRQEVWVDVCPARVAPRPVVPSRRVIWLVSIVQQQLARLAADVRRYCIVHVPLHARADQDAGRPHVERRLLSRRHDLQHPPGVRRLPLLLLLLLLLRLLMLLRLLLMLMLLLRLLLQQRRLRLGSCSITASVVRTETSYQCSS